MYHLIRGDLSLLFKNIFCKLWERYFILFLNLNLFLFLKIYQNIQKTHYNFTWVFFFFAKVSWSLKKLSQASEVKHKDEFSVMNTSKDNFFVVLAA